VRLASRLRAYEEDSNDGGFSPFARHCRWLIVPVKQFQHFIEPLRWRRALKCEIQPIFFDRPHESLINDKSDTKNLLRTWPVPISSRTLLAGNSNAVQTRKPATSHLQV